VASEQALRTEQPVDHAGRIVRLPERSQLRGPRIIDLPSIRADEADPGRQRCQNGRTGTACFLVMGQRGQPALWNLL
jgi:hypothetical protein